MRVGEQQRQKQTLTTKEWGFIAADKSGLSSEDLDGFQRAAKIAAQKLRLPEGAVLSRVVGGLKAGQVCGVVSHLGHSLEILPKIEGASGAESRHALIRMLSVAHDLRISDGEIALLANQRRDVFELLVRLFANRLRRAMKGGLQRQYMRDEDELPFVRGSLDVNQQLTKRPVAPTKMFCRFDDLSENTPLNRLLKATLRTLLRVSGSQDTQRELYTLSDAFRNVANSSNPLAERFQLDRTTSAYDALVPLARLLLQGHWQSTTMGGVSGTSLLFSMNVLFERYVARRALQTVGSGIVSKQHTRHHVLNNKLFRMIPDLVFEYESGPVIVDTKWKQLDISDNSKLGVAQSDVYQMLAYGHGYSTGGAMPHLVLLYPHIPALERPEGIQREWSVTGTGFPLSVCTVDISKRRSPQEWRGLFSKIAPETSHKELRAV